MRILLYKWVQTRAWLKDYTFPIKIKDIEIFGEREKRTQHSVKMSLIETDIVFPRVMIL